MDIIQDYLSLAIEVAREAGDFAHRAQVSELQITTKTNEMDLVTQIDSRNEQTIRDTVLARYPDHVFLGEELGASDGLAGSTAPRVEQDSPRVAQRFQPATVRWIIDPIDGTVNFAHGMPIWCVSVGVEVDGVVECGAIYNPNLNELFTVRRGQGAYLNGKRMAVSKQGNPLQSLFVTGFPYNVNENPGSVIEQFVSFLSRGLLVRRLGSAALDLAYVACGRFDAFWEMGLSPWDTSAGQLMVREAGGRVTHYDGSDYNIYKKSIIASNGLHHEMIFGVLSDTKGIKK
ncbi:MAG: inositol monophosphatase family protein [Candidatus Kapaibacterium sp.]